MVSVTDAARLTRYGGDCYAYCMLAMGFIDIVIESSLQPYDVQALIPIVEAAGGIITDWSGKGCDNGGNVVACGDHALHGADHLVFGHPALPRAIEAGG